MAVADAVTIQWVTALCQALHKQFYVQCCSLPSHMAPRWPLAIWGCISSSGMSLLFKQVRGTWIKKREMVRAARKGGDLPYDWFAVGPKSHKAAEKVRVTSWDLGANRRAPQTPFSHCSHFCPQMDTWWKKRRERLMPIVEVCNLMARNQTCHM